MTIVRRVLDISHHNTVTDLQAVADAGIWGIIHKATQSTNFKDDKYPGRKSGFLEVGLLWGAYHFMVRGNVEAQVDYFLNYAGVDDQTLYALDWETEPNSGTAPNEDEAEEFMRLLEQKTGRKGVVYSGNTAKEEISGINEYLGSCRMWLAQYSSSCSTQASWNNNVWLWQYSDGANGPSPHGCPGVEGYVDTNSWTDSEEKLRREWSGGSGVRPGPTPPPDERPTISKGDTGPDVEYLQEQLNSDNNAGLTVDGDFGNATDSATRNYQASRGLDVDGIVGPVTWEALDSDMPPYVPPELPSPIDPADQEAIAGIASRSSIASYSWRDRGVAPLGYMQGFALAFANVYRKLDRGHAPSMEMAKARSSSSKDVFNVYRSDFDALDMDNSESGVDALRHLYALLLGLGMRESSGQYCCGRDQSASNTDSNTCEAGLYQTSYNAHSCDATFDQEFNEYSAATTTDNPQGFVDYFSRGVTCDSANWACYGSGNGYKFQEMCKKQPAFAVETCAITLRNLCNHYGPVNRHEVELKKEAEDMLRQVQAFVDAHRPPGSQRSEEAVTS